MNKKIIIPLLSFIILAGLFSWSRIKNSTPSIEIGSIDSIEIETSAASPLEQITASQDFWQKKLDANAGNFPAMLKLSNLLTKRYTYEGEVRNLEQAYTYLKNALEISAMDTDDIKKALVPAAIKMHRFDEAAAYAASISHKDDAAYLLTFDALMETGDFSGARKSLDHVTDKAGFHYLVRQSKWLDHIGNLDAAVFTMEKATKLIEDSSLESLKLWSASNLADMYGHQGKVKKSFAKHKEVLQKDPSYFHSLQSIAWIYYAGTNKNNQALTILNNLYTQLKEPGILLDIADIYASQGNVEQEKETLQTFMHRMNTEPAYAEMYVLTYAELLADAGNFDQAQSLLEQELKKRPTPEVYDQLAWHYFQKEEYNKAAELWKKQVEDQTFEPTTQVHAALIFQKAGDTNRAKKYLAEAMDASFEIGPNQVSALQKSSE